MESTLELPALITLVGGVNWTVGFLTTVGIFAMLALALNLQWGYTGVFNFGIVAFFMVGAYTSALLTLEPSGDFENHILGLEWPIPLGWIGGAVAAGVLALLIGLPTLRLRRDFLAIATIGVATILRSIVNSTEGLANRGAGLIDIPRFLDGLAEGADYRWVMLGIVLVMLAAVYAVLGTATASPWGRVLRGVRDNEDTAMAAGKHTTVFRVQSFVLGGMMMGLAGAIFAHRQGAISPTGFSDLFGTFLVWTMLIVGGEREQSRCGAGSAGGRVLLVRDASDPGGPAGVPGHARVPAPRDRDRGADHRVPVDAAGRPAGGGAAGVAVRAAASEARERLGAGTRRRRPLRGRLPCEHQLFDR